MFYSTLYHIQNAAKNVPTPKMWLFSNNCMFFAIILSIIHLRLLYNSVSVYCSNLCYSKCRKQSQSFTILWFRPVLLISRFGALKQCCSKCYPVSIGAFRPCNYLINCMSQILSFCFVHAASHCKSFWQIYGLFYSCLSFCCYGVVIFLFHADYLRFYAQWPSVIRVCVQLIKFIELDNTHDNVADLNKIKSGMFCIQESLSSKSGHCLPDHGCITTDSCVIFEWQNYFPANHDNLPPNLATNNVTG